jgi:prepilin-type N-terminal cleavage/methylation domain-containing protein
MRTNRTSPKQSERRGGFTLVELMVSLTLGALVIGSVYTLGAVSARHFQEQQRVSQLQLSTRIALERVRRDASLAGFGGTPDSEAERSCGTGGGVNRFFGVTVTDRDPGGMTALATMPGAAGSNVHADRLRMVGNFDTGDVYLVRDYSGVSINLQTNWQGFRRSFIDQSGTAIDTDLFDAVFDAGRIVRITHPTGGTFFATIGSTTIAGPGNVTVRLTTSLPACADVCMGCTIAPLSGVEYFLAPAPEELESTIAAAVTGPNTVLMRGLFDPNTGLSTDGTARPVLEWAVHFDVDAIVNTAAITTLLPALALQNDTTVTGAGGLRASGIYSLDVTLAARTPEQDANFPWVAPVAGRPLTRFRSSTTLPGAMRVRTAHSEILLPNIAYRGM